ncbi:Catechol O-methyltransferase [Symbiodinium microadriaticum]|uniref:Catechol O-methyltransferase n=1 Tax=Symbiodinium microadriaticum TaxID=2951 RepID=A0A1Q9EUD6_SYMMI|nr:Catechol O-methyltransferase [Symbiodinium microadriaticum]
MKDDRIPGQLFSFGGQEEDVAVHDSAGLQGQGPEVEAFWCAAKAAAAATRAKSADLPRHLELLKTSAEAWRPRPGRSSNKELELLRYVLLSATPGDAVLQKQRPVLDVWSCRACGKQRAMQAMMLLVAQGQTWQPYQVQAPLRPQRPRATASVRHQGSTAAAAAAVLAATAASGRRPRCSRAASDDELGYGREDIGPGGEDPEGRYTWERCGMEVVVTASIDEDVTKKDISADWSLRKASLKIKGEALFDGIPGCELDVDECFWEIDEDDDGNKKLMVHLKKLVIGAEGYPVPVAGHLAEGWLNRAGQKLPKGDGGLTGAAECQRVEKRGAPRRGREAAPAQDADTAMEDVAFEALLEKRVHQEYDKDVDSVCEMIERFGTDVLQGGPVTGRWLKIAACDKAQVLRKALQDVAWSVDGKILEIGAYCGYSAMRMCQAVPSNVTITSLENEPLHAVVATVMLEFAGLSDRTKVRIGHSEHLLPRLAGNTFQAVFLDSRGSFYDGEVALMEKFDLLSQVSLRQHYGILHMTKAKVILVLPPSLLSSSNGEAHAAGKRLERARSR